MTTVVDDDGRLLGVISDGDLRRQMERHGPSVLERTAFDCMTSNPVLIDRRELATQALAVMEERKITSLVIADDKAAVLGVVHLHDLWRTGMV